MEINNVKIGKKKKTKLIVLNLGIQLNLQVGTIISFR